jgi:hypothetical protein
VIGRLALVLAAVIATGIGGHPAAAATGDAATVNAVGITVDEFNEVATGLADAGLTQFAASPVSRTIDGEAGRNLLTVLVTNEAVGQFLAERGEEPVTEADIDAFFEESSDPSLQSLEGAARVTFAENQLYAGRLDAIEPDASTMRDQYERSPASLGVYCATAISVADAEQADAVIAAIGDGATPEEAGGESVSDWQCSRLASVADPELMADLVAAVPGDAVGPASTGDGLVVLVIDGFDTAEPKLENFFLRLEDDASGTSAGTVLFQGFLFNSDVSVDPRYGRWDPLTGAVVALGA